MIYSWIFDSGGAGRGAWQGGVIYEFLRFSRENGCYPRITMGASAGAYAAADAATGTEGTVMKGWTHWGKARLAPGEAVPESCRGLWGMNRFRFHLYDSLSYVMAEEEVSRVFDGDEGKKLLVFTTRVRRRDGRPFTAADSARMFLKSATRKFPARVKYLPGAYVEDPVIFATNLPGHLRSDCVRPLTRGNYHRVIEASCTIPLAMGAPIPTEAVRPPGEGGRHEADAPDSAAAFMDGGFALKMPMAAFEEDARFRALGRWAAADRTIVFCCDPRGQLWETSSRLRALNSLASVGRDVGGGRLLLVWPDHKVEAGFLCQDNDAIMRTFERGREQGRRLLHSDRVKKFFERPT